MLTYCVNCRDRYLAKGRPAWHLLELAYPKAGDIKRKSPSWSQRQQNRAALKRRLLARHWGEHIEEARAMELYLSEELENKLEETHILHSDIEKTIARAEAENQKLQDPATGRFTASFRPANVTFWVEYSPEGAGYRVHNAWCHRMAAILTSKLTESGAAEA